MCSGAIPVVPRLHLPSIDVRDCAEAHIKALQAEPGTLQGQRIIISQDSYWMADFTRHISASFPALTKVATREVGYKTLKIASFFDSQVKLIMPMIGLEMYTANEKSKTILGMKYERDLLKTMEEMI